MNNQLYGCKPCGHVATTENPHACESCGSLDLLIINRDDNRCGDCRWWMFIEGGKGTCDYHNTMTFFNERCEMHKYPKAKG